MSTNGMVFRIKDKTEVAPAAAEVDQDGRIALAPGGVGEQANASSEEAEQVSDSGIKEIVLRAPVGHGITEALNLLLCTKKNKTGVIRSESNMTQIMASNVDDQMDEETLSPSEVNKAYIFVQDGRKMNLGEIDAMVEGAKAAKSGGAGYVGVVVEGMDEIASNDPHKHEFMAEGVLHMESFGIPVMYTRMRVVSTVEKLLGVS